MYKYILLVSLFLLGSCMKDSQQTIQHGNFEVEFLFEQDGCRMYRFFDGQYIYWSDCSGKVSYETSNGKTVSKMQSITSK